MRRPADARQRPSHPLRGFRHTLWRRNHRGQPQAPIAAQPQARRPSRRARRASIPPSANAGQGSARASAAQRSGPSPGAPGWLAVAKAGETSAASARSRRARATPARPCTATDSSPAPARKGSRWRTPRRSGTCSPARSASASRPSPATMGTSPRARAARAAARITDSGRSRSSTAAPRGSRARMGSGSGRRRASVSSHSRGGALAARRRSRSVRGMSDSIASRLAAIRARIEAATAAAGRPAGSVALVAVSKTHPAAAVEAALLAGQTIFGENRVQEAAAKFPALRPAHPALRLHVIGGLQTNKARDAVRLADVIESLDRPKLALAIKEAMEKEGRRPDLLIQVNTGDEPQKSGIPRAEADAFIAACLGEWGLPVRGLMCIPPADADPRPHFALLRAMAARHRLPVLSMGMSGDFEAAIAEGATHVRVGSAIFGNR